jgi:hypothetical protein
VTAQRETPLERFRREAPARAAARAGETRGQRARRGVWAAVVLAAVAVVAIAVAALIVVAIISAVTDSTAIRLLGAIAVVAVAGLAWAKIRG